MQLLINTEVLKEPRGFIKFVEIFLAICAFATAVGPHVSASIQWSCYDKTGSIQLSVQYPCDLTVTTFVRPFCENSTNETVQSTSSSPSTEYTLPVGCKSASEFYVFIGVVVFLFSFGAIIFYVIAHEQYSGFSIIPKVDFVITISVAVLWLISSSAFANAVVQIKNYTNLQWLCSASEIPFAKDLNKQNVECHPEQQGNYATLNVSIIFGFLNLFVWCGNNWFLYKETSWFSRDTPTPTQPVPSSTSEVQPKI